MIPNIEEEKVAVKLWNIALDEDNKNARQEFRDVLHQQLQKALEVQAIQIREEEANEYNQIIEREVQKARRDWLREEIVKLEEEKIKTLPSALDDTTGFLLGHGKNITIQTIIDRYHSELDQPTLEDKE